MFYLRRISKVDATEIMGKTVTASMEKGGAIEALKILLVTIKTCI